MTTSCFLCSDIISDKNCSEISLEPICDFCIGRIVESAKVVHANLHNSVSAHDSGISGDDDDDGDCDNDDDDRITPDNQKNIDMDSDRRDNLANKRNVLYRAFAWVAGV